MKWVWNQGKDMALNLAHIEYISITEGIEQSFVVEAWVETDPCTLKSFNTLQAAQEFVSDITGAISGGSPETTVQWIPSRRRSKGGSKNESKRKPHSPGPVLG